MPDKPKAGPRIKVQKDGPYCVTGRVPLDEQRIRLGRDGEPARWEQGRVYPGREAYSLCRCGASRDKPFCDGRHAETGFDGTETAGPAPYLDDAERTVGPGVDLTWSPTFCMSARFCHAGQDAWNYAEASDDPEARAKAIREACDCPSGSLVAWDKAGEAIEPACPPGISLVEDPDTGVPGPIWVKGRIPIVSAKGREYECRNRVTLCRCGRSGNKPFCDGSHKTHKNE